MKNELLFAEGYGVFSRGDTVNERGEPVADIVVKYVGLKGVEIDPKLVPRPAPTTTNMPIKHI